MTFLYKIDFPDDKSYIGVAESLVKRFATHMGLAKRGPGEKSYSLVNSAMAKHKFDFEVTILAIGERQYIFELEKKAIAAYDTRIPNGYNISIGGICGRFGAKLPRITRIRMSVAKNKHFRLIRESDSKQIREERKWVDNSNDFLRNRAKYL